MQYDQLSQQQLSFLLSLHESCVHILALSDRSTRAVPEFGSGRNPAFFTNPADIRLRPKLGQILNFAGFEILPDLENFH